ncbi:MAG TPA: hypothetical protein VFB62_01355, partial [Polyangiaceae bacterium]|nr:hypothetical protein [Polyangiaceae bacterium]
QALATGSPWSSAQHAYYAVSDGPPDCFRYGFGAGIGCLGEHGDFVRHNLSDGYGLGAALATTGRRIKMHLGDALNFAPLVALVVMGGVLSRRAAAARALGIAVIAQVLAYVPFYFDGNYPGGGARMFADVLPHEHVLAALGLFALAPAARLSRLAGVVLALSLTGFAFQSGGEHRALAEREGGRPMFDASIVGGRQALIFLDTDHGFNLAYEPGRRNVARFHGDGIDRLAWEAAGRPTAFRYHHAWNANEEPHLEPLDFELDGLRIEAESLWPPLTQRGGWSWPSHSPRKCVSGGRVLALYPTERESEVTLMLPEALGGRRLEVAALLGIDPASQEETSMIIEIYSGGTRLVDWRIKGPSGCVTMPPFELPEPLHQPLLVLKARDPVAIDMLDLGEKR